MIKELIRIYINDSNLGLSALFNIAVTLIGIGVAWWALQSLRFDVFLKHPGEGKAKLLHLMLAVIIGYMFGKFIIEYVVWSSMLKYIF